MNRLTFILLVVGSVGSWVCGQTTQPLQVYRELAFYVGQAWDIRQYPLWLTFDDPAAGSVVWQKQDAAGGGPVGGPWPFLGDSLTFWVLGHSPWAGPPAYPAGFFKLTVTRAVSGEFEHWHVDVVSCDPQHPLSNTVYGGGVPVNDIYMPLYGSGLLSSGVDYSLRPYGGFVLGLQLAGGLRRPNDQSPYSDGYWIDPPPGGGPAYPPSTQPVAVPQSVVSIGTDDLPTLRFGPLLGLASWGTGGGGGLGFGSWSAAGGQWQWSPSLQWYLASDAKKLCDSVMRAFAYLCVFRANFAELRRKASG